MMETYLICDLPMGTEVQKKRIMLILGLMTLFQVHKSCSINGTGK